MRKSIQNTIINILLLSPLFILIYYYKDHPFFGEVIKGFFWFIVVIAGGSLVVWGATRITISTMNTISTLKHMYEVWKESRKVVKQDDRFEICSKCSGKGYTFWVNNINGKPSK